MNEQIEPYALADASFLFGYFGSTSSGLRQRLNPILKVSHDNNIALVEVRDAIWNKMFDRSGLQEKIDYAENLRRCRFIICPKGAVLAGAGSRLYETMQAERVPVIISDRITLPEGIDWKSCSIRIRERDIKKIPLILKSYDGQWPELARNAREVYVKHFSREAIIGEIGRQLDDLLAENDKISSFTYIDAVFRIALGKLALWVRRSLGKIKRIIKN